MKHSAIIVLTSIALAFPGSAQTCDPGGTVLCGPVCGAFYNLVTDSHFEDGCPEWDFSNAVSRSTESLSCGTGSYHAKVSGGNAWVAEMSQWVTADEGTGNFSFSYAVAIDDADSEVEVYIDGPDEDPMIHSVSGVTSCQTFSIDLGSHPEWVDEIIGIYFRIYVPDAGKTVRIDRVSLWQQIY